MEKVPILLLVFCRKENTMEMFKSVREYKPQKLYIAADGPRPHKVGETEACKETRHALLEAIDWDCEVKTLFRTENLGCAHAVYGAISWFFEQEPWGVIIEDDIIISQDFYRLCEELLPRYKNDKHIQQIAAQNFNTKCRESNTYTFQKKTFIWGWATWRRSWQSYMDMTMSNWPNYRMKNLVKYYGYFQTVMMFHYWNKGYKHLSTNSSWATRWHLAAVTNDLISICPKTNLAVNIGCTGENGTHYVTGSEDPYKHLRIGKMTFPLQHPAEIKLDREQLNIDNTDFIRIKKIGAKQIIKRFFKITISG